MQQGPKNPKHKPGLSTTWAASGTNKHAAAATTTSASAAYVTTLGVLDTTAVAEKDFLPLLQMAPPLIVWSEYRDLAPGDVLMTVEHCHKCHQHRATTRHDEQVGLLLRGLGRVPPARIPWGCRLRTRPKYSVIPRESTATDILTADHRN